MYTKIKKCRICGNRDLVSVLKLGNQYLTGVFPGPKNMRVTSGPLELTKCRNDRNPDNCGLLQLQHSYDHQELYGNNYGYRSGLNASMVEHLRKRVAIIEKLVRLKKNDLVIDIGSNDSTLLQGYHKPGLLLAGIDPSGEGLRKYYPKHIKLIPDFFSANALRKIFGSKRAKVVTSIAMFYDLESPVDFARQVVEVLADDGIWVFEQSYMPAMLEMNAYDTICHEHLEYYSLRQIKWITDLVGLKIIDIEFNKINGGSFAVTVAKNCSAYNENTGLIRKVLLSEKRKGLDRLKPYAEFKQRILRQRLDLLRFIKEAKSRNKTIFGYGASTKGNVILQYCNITREDIPYIAEVNSDKFGCRTPGTNIPIISEEEARKMRPDYFLVLPWHFRDNILIRERDYLKSGGELVFPLPLLKII